VSIGSLPILPSAAPGEEGVVLRGDAARQAIIDGALRLFTRHGIAATSLDQVVREAGVARMTLYHHFKSKDGLILAALEYEGAQWRRWFFSEIVKLKGAPRQKLLNVFDIVEAWFGRENYFGCAFMNAILEQRAQYDPVIAVTAAHKLPVLEQLEALSRAAGAPDPARLGYQIDLLINGAIVNAVIQKTVRPAAEAKMIAGFLIDAVCDPEAAPERCDPS
jgi:AcrR family transcriptional regulator